jgi:multimeric flavodoxin WrbA/protein-tyrosine-phosphatase
MFALGLQGSPRKKGNNDILLTRLMDALAERGARTHIVDVARRKIEPCMELTVCEQKGYCPIDDDMGQEIYGLLRKADLVVAASPVFFYGVSAQLKALIDRCQTLWARRYMLKLKDPGRTIRRGFLLAVGATSGKQLFDGIHLTAKYFFDGISADYTGSLTYRRVERRGQIKDQPELDADIDRAADDLTKGLAQRHRILFVCPDNGVAAPMAAAFTRLYAGDRFDPLCAGALQAAPFDALMVEAMAEKGIDMAYLPSASLEEVVDEHHPHEIIALGGAIVDVPGTDIRVWDLAVPEDNTLAGIRLWRDAIEQQVNTLIKQS